MSNTPSSTDVKADDEAPITKQPGLGPNSDAQDSAKRPQPVPSESQQLETSPPGDLKYLVAEDNSVNRKVMTILMRRLDLEQQCHMVVNGQEAVDTYKKNPQQCRLIFMDTSMPIKDGLRASKEIREYERENDLSPAVILGLTVSIGIGEEYDSKQIERLKNEFGMNGAVQKPLREAHLRSAIESWPV
ncbi:hypothetical protein ACHAPT_006252 [Fusarium lateritium]